jgi:hypothetical protein
MPDFKSTPRALFEFSHGNHGELPIQAQDKHGLPRQARDRREETSTTKLPQPFFRSPASMAIAAASV